MRSLKRSIASADQSGVVLPPFIVFGIGFAALFELIDSKDLAVLQSVADFGILVVTCRGGWCSFANSTTRMDLDLERLWPLIQQLTSAADKIHARAPIRE